MSSASAPIFVCDSGIGGLSILRQLLAIAPSASYYYLADQKYFPYSEHTPAWLQARLESLVAFGVAQHAQAIVVACNTASVHSLDYLRARFHLPIFGVEPVVKPLLPYQHPLLLTTTSTAHSPHLAALIAQFAAQHLQVLGLPHLASTIESCDSAASRALIKTHLSGLTFDAIGLSCTHYPLISPLFAELFPTAQILDPSVAVASHIVRRLELGQGSGIGERRFATTLDVLRLNHQLQYYLDLSSRSELVTI